MWALRSWRGTRCRLPGSLRRVINTFLVLREQGLGAREASQSLGIRKHFASKEQLGLDSKQRTQWVYPCKDIEIRVERGDVGILRTGRTKAWPPRPSFYRYDNSRRSEKKKK